MSKQNDRGEYWYNYQDINNLLKAKCQDNLYKVIDATSTDNLQTLQRVNEAFTVLNKSNSFNVVVLPINIGRICDEGTWQGSHWVGLVLKKVEANTCFKVFYTDSLGTPMETSVPALKQILINHGVRSDNVIECNNNLPVAQQSNSYDCGPWTVFNLDALARTDALANVNKEEIIQQRKTLLEEVYDLSTLRFPELSITDNNRTLPLLSDHITFPRCEYKARFKRTSAFAMLDPEYWGTYFRSTSRGGNCDRIAKLLKSSKTYENRNINISNKDVISPSKSGSIQSPWKHDDYKKMFNTKNKSKKKLKNNGTLLYDQLLQYKTYICNTVVKEFSIREIPDKKIDVYAENDYPGIMVQINDFTKLLKPKQEQSSLYNIVIAYFIALTNSVACNYKIPIEMVNRASFGHNIPSVAETAKSFRINIGIVPKSYTEVLVSSLELLNTKFLVPLLNKNKNKATLKLSFSQEETDCLNKDIDVYNNKIKTSQQRKVEKWNKDDNLMDVLCKVGDLKGKKVSFQITRNKKHVDLLVNYASKHLSHLDDNTQDFAKPLIETLRKLSYKSKATLNAKIDDYNTSQFEFSNDENQYIKDDERFWRIIQNISSVYEAVGIKSLCHAITNKRIKGLNKILEEANLEFIKNSSDHQSETGYGSSSDCKVSIEKMSFYSRKITVATGMRAINLARFLSIFQARTLKADTKYMYYETNKSIKNIKDIRELNSECSVNNSNSEIVQYIDLSYCAADGPTNSKVILKDIESKLSTREEVIVFDYTSATSELINEAIKLFIKKVPVLLLVSSGLKNEQIGADMNPYGTLRIIARDYNDLNKLYYILKATLTPQERLPKELHNIRKAYKDAGAVVTNAAIYTKDRGYIFYYTRNTTDNYLANSNIDDNDVPDELKKIALLFSGQYEDEFNNLTNEHGNDLEEIISWDFKKIEFLGSDTVIDAIEKFDDYHENTFKQIEEEYNIDDEFTRDIVYAICNSIYSCTTMDFAALVQEYRARKQDDETSIDDILAEENYDRDLYRVGFAYAKQSGAIDSGISTPNSSTDDDSNRFDFDESIDY